MTLWVYAHPSEGRQVSPHLAPTLALGVGKVAAAVALADHLARHHVTRVVALGLCGAYPVRHRAGARAPHVGDVCLVEHEVLADEGVLMPEGFVDLDAMGLGTSGPWHADPELLASLRRVLGEVAVVRGATVSTVTGTDAASQAVATRTGAQVESMEGAAIALACEAAGVPWAQVRVVSNETGDRALGRWDLEGALAGLGRVARQLAVLQERGR